MDNFKKKALIQNASLIQSTVIITRDVLQRLKLNDVISGEEASTIEKDEVPSGKALELVCLLKKKDNRTFNKFLQTLDELNFTVIADNLRNQPVQDETQEDKSTANKLSAYLKNVDPKVIQDLARRFVPKEVHNDIVYDLREQLAAATASKQNHLAPPTARTSLSHSLPSSPSAALAAKVAAYHQLEGDYKNMADAFKQLQHEYEQTVEINCTYAHLLSELQQLQIPRPFPTFGEGAGGANSDAAEAREREDSETIRNLEAKVEEYKQQAEELRIKLDDVTAQLEESNKQLSKVEDDERRMRKKLQLPADATEEEVSAKLTQLLKSASNNAESSKLQRDIQKLADDRAKLENAISHLKRENEITSMTLRQTKLQLRQLTNRQSARPLLTRINTILPQHQFKFPDIHKVGAGRQIGPPSAIANSDPRYCIFCLSDTYTSKACRIHFKAFRDSKWLCCNDTLHRSAGCIRVPHCFIVKSDSNLTITDGSQYMRLML